MSSLKTTDIIGNIYQYRYNPTLIHRASLEMLKQLYDENIELVDPTNPFIFCLENTAFNAAAFMQQNENSTRRLYPIAAITEEDLYLHMSDREYVDRFAKPSTATFKIIYDRDELVAAMIDDPVEGVKKVTIPKNTFFTVGDIVFSLQYPIDIRQLPHGGLQVIYDTTDVSPLQTLETNVIEWRPLLNNQGQRFIEFDVLVEQFFIKTFYNDVTAASGLVSTISLTDSFYYVRVYNQVSGSYVEIKTTHTDQIYDPATPTALVKVLSDRVDVSIPPIYASNGLIRGKIRIDVYETKGRLIKSLSGLAFKDFTMEYLAIDPKDSTDFTSPLGGLRTTIVYSTTAVDGGRAALSFDELKQRVINNSTGVKNLPITNNQLESTILDNNYDLVKNVDTITNRIFLASRFINKPVDEKILTSAGTAMLTIQTSLRKLKNAYAVKDNVDSFTITPSSVFKEVNATTYPITNSEYASLDTLPVIAKTTEVSNNSYFYTPFYYVLDNSRERFDVRAYDLDSPAIEAKTFVAENIATGLQVSINDIAIQKTDSGYLLTLSTLSSESFQNLPDTAIAVQLSYFPKDSTTRAYFNGQYLTTDPSTKERFYKFEINTNLNIDKEHFIDMPSFSIDLTGFTLKASLTQLFDFFFIVDKDQTGSAQTSTIDSKINTDYLSFQNGIGLTHERFNLVFGYPLKNLWQRHKTVVEQTPYEVYTENVPALYEQDVYEIDPATGAAFEIDANGDLVYNILHHRGDPVFTATGQPVYRHHIGEVKTDVYGNPIIPAGYTKDLTRLCDILMIDAVYRFSTDPIVKTYQEQMRNAITSWILTDIDQFNKRALEQTKVFFYPKNTVSKIRVLDNQNNIVSMDAQQKLKIKLYVPPVTFTDTALLDALVKTTIKAIDIELQKPTISTSAIQTTLRAIYSKDVVEVTLEGLGAGVSSDTFTLVNKADRCSIKKRLVALADGVLAVREAIDIEIVKHGLD